MLKITALLFIICSLISPVFSATYTTGTNYTNTPDGMHNRLSGTGPSFDGIRRTDRDLEMQTYAIVKTILSNVENEYLRRIMIYLDVAKEKTDKYFMHRDYTFPDDITYFQMAVNSIGNNDFLLIGIGQLQAAREKLDIIGPSLKALKVTPEELNNVQYRIRKNNAVFHMFRGNQADVRKAVAEFLIILQMKEKNEISFSEQELLTIYTYLAGCYHLQYERDKYYNSGVAMINGRLELYYLWKLTELKNADNAELKDIKLSDLSKKYYPIIDYNSFEYKEMYKPFLDKLGLQYKSIEEKTQERINNENKAETTPVSK